MLDFRDCFEFKNYNTISKLKPEYQELEFLQTPGLCEEISPRCFEGCKAKAIFITGYVKRIGVEAFKNCKNLKYIYLPAYLEVIDKDALAGCDKVVVMCASEEGYCWFHPEKHYEIYVESAGFNFHRSSGGWADPNLDMPTGGNTPRPYNPLNRPVLTNVSSQTFFDALAKDGIK